MAATKIDQGTIIILDIGKNVSCSEEKNEKSFFEKARECTSRIIERKIMTQGKSLVGIILLGSKKTNNTMSEQCDGAFKHIDTFFALQEPTWQMIRDLPDTPTKSKGDWLEALIVAADHFKNGVSGYKILNKKIIIITNFMYLTELLDDADQVLNGLKDDEIEVDVFGPDLFEKNEKSDIELAQKFVEATQGATATFDFTMRYLLFHKKKAVNPMPWNVDLSIGPNIKIPVSTYLRIKDEPVVKKWMKAIKDPVTTTASTTEGIMIDKVFVNTEDQTNVESGDIIKGYYYGQKLIPLSEYEKSMLYASGPKCLSVYGFTHASSINWQNLTGDGLSYVFGRKGDAKAQNAIRCLVECLHELNLVGIVRRVYNNNNGPKMYVLMPVIDTNDFICLSMMSICFKEDIKHMSFPVTNLKKYACTDEQIDAFKELIKAMDLTKAYDDTFDDAEAFPVAETVSPSAQYVLDCIAFRAMNPGKPLPPPRDDIMMLFKQPPSIEKRSREPLDKLKKIFTLNKVEVKKRQQKKTEQIDAELMKPPADLPLKYQTKPDMPKVNLPKTENVSRIGTVDPVGDFMALLSIGKSLPEIKSEISEAIENLFYYNFDETYVKAIEAMSCFRTKCVKSNPAPYNEWFQKFKNDLMDRKKNNVLDIIAENKLSFILKEENSSSTYEQEDSNESQLYENDTVPDSIDLSLQSDVNDLFDD